jgi:hypothetical protein
MVLARRAGRRRPLVRGCAVGEGEGTTNAPILAGFDPVTVPVRTRPRCGRRLRQASRHSYARRGGRDRATHARWGCSACTASVDAARSSVADQRVRWPRRPPNADGRRPIDGPVTRTAVTIAHAALE